MPSVPNIYLKDSSGNSYLVGVADDGSYNTTPTSVAAPTSILINDSVTASQSWLLQVDTSGALSVTSTTYDSSAPTKLLAVTPTGTVRALVILAGAISTVPGSVCQFALSDADAALAARLYDPTGQFWPQAERLLYLQEAMRTWNALTGYWRGDFLFNAQAQTTWYDLTDLAVAPNTLRPLTLSVTDLYTIIEYHLLEPPVGAGTWTGSAQFALSDIQGAVARRRDETLGVTGCYITRIVVPAVPGRTTLPQTTLEVRRIAFLPVAGQGSPSVLWQDDSWAWQAFEPSYTTAPAGTPTSYALTTQPVFTFDVDVPPAVPGSYEILTVQSGTPINSPLGTGNALFIPDDWAWVPKWGALAELLGRESNAKDPLRAKYAEGRYKQGLALLSAAPALLGLRASNIPLQIDAVRAADQYQTSWQARDAGPPEQALVAGLNLIALVPVPDTGVGVSIDPGTITSASVNGAITLGSNLGSVAVTMPILASGDLLNGGVFEGGGSVVINVVGVTGAPTPYTATLASGATWVKVTLANGTHQYVLQAVLASPQGPGTLLIQTANVGAGLWPGSAATTQFTISISFLSGASVALGMQAGGLITTLSGQPYSLTVTVIENAPVPVAQSDCLLLTQDVYEAILDEAQHLAAFKQGGEEFLSTLPLHQRFLSMAALYASKIAEMGEFAKILYQQSQQELALNPRYSEDLDPAVGANG